jgi:hypothetical protein
MRFLLTSAGIKNTSIHDALVDLLGKPIAESNALCIPTAAYGHPMAGPGAAWRFINGREPRCPMCELGWKSLGVNRIPRHRHAEHAGQFHGQRRKMGALAQLQGIAASHVPSKSSPRGTGISSPSKDPKPADRRWAFSDARPSVGSATPTSAAALRRSAGRVCGNEAPMTCQAISGSWFCSSR